MFLTRTKDGLLAETEEQQKFVVNSQAVCVQLKKELANMTKSYATLQKTTGNNSACQTQKIRELQQKLDEIPVPKFTEGRKEFHDLKHAQQSVVKREIRDVIGSELDTFLKKRKLSLGYMVLEHVGGEKENIRIYAHHRKYEELTPIQLETVARITEEKIIQRMADDSYASLRRIVPDLPFFTHVKQHYESIVAQLPPLEDAPVKSGAFLSIRDEIRRQLEHGHKMGAAILNEGEVIVKLGVDAAKLTHYESVCVYSLETIFSGSSKIGLIGAVLGSDSYQDMEV